MIKVAKTTYVYISVYIYIQIYTNVPVCTRLPDLICLTTLAKGWTVGEKLVQTQEDGTPDRLRVGLLESFCPFGPESLFNPCGKCLSIFVRTSVLFWTFYRLQPGVDRTSYQTTKMCPCYRVPQVGTPSDHGLPRDGLRIYISCWFGTCFTELDDGKIYRKPLY